MQTQTLIGQSQFFNLALEQLSQIAPLDKPVLIIGERGTGKELLAERLHFLSRRWDKPFLKLNCAALSDSLLESALFGHEAGAFTGASKQNQGIFERAEEGTLFLDELGTTSTRVQEKLLRVIEYGEFERLGGQKTLTVDVRVVGATNADLPAMAARGEFRADLLDRLAFDVVNLPPLRQRSDDILPLAEHFAIAMCRQLDRAFFSGFTHRASQQLLDYSWPGNVRELKNAVERSIYRLDDEQQPVEQIILDPFQLPWQPTAKTVAAPEESQPNNEPEPTTTGLKQAVIALEKAMISQALAANRYQQKPTAEQLALSYHQLRGYLKKYPELLGD